MVSIFIASVALMATCYSKAKEPEEQIPVVVKAVEITLSPVDYAELYASQYQIDESVFKKVMWCESNNNPDAIGDNGKAKNVYQFHKQTFDSYSKKVGEGLDYNSYHDQIKTAAYMFSIGQARQWTTYRAIMNGGVYIFTDRNGITHTVHCKL